MELALYTTWLTQKAKKYHDGFLQLAITGSHGKQGSRLFQRKKLIFSFLQILQMTSQLPCSLKRKRIKIARKRDVIRNTTGNLRLALSSNRQVFAGGSKVVMQLEAPLRGVAPMLTAIGLAPSILSTD